LRQDHIESICCSFCDTPQEIVDKLIRSRRSTKAAYICDKCVDAGARMMEQDALSPQNLWLWIKGKIGIHNSHLRHANQ
jgi:ATP-dependent protease Clp ATPase subunit